MRVGVATVAGGTTHGDKAVRLIGQNIGDISYSSICRDNQVESLVPQNIRQGFREVRIADQSFNMGRNGRIVMTSPVEHRDVIAALDKAPEDMWPRGSGAANNQCFQIFVSLWKKRRQPTGSVEWRPYFTA